MNEDIPEEKKSAFRMLESFVKEHAPDKEAALHAYVARVLENVRHTDDNFLFFEMMGWNALILEKGVEAMERTKSKIDPEEMRKIVRDEVNKIVSADIVEKVQAVRDEATQVRKSIDSLDQEVKTYKHQVEAISNAATNIYANADSLVKHLEVWNSQTKEGTSSYATIAHNSAVSIDKLTGIEGRLSSKVTSFLIVGFIFLGVLQAVMHFILR